jgi:glycosyltransferase involved in cell wall biosynthesis
LPRLLRSRAPLLGRLTQWALRRFDAIIVVNNHIAQILEAVVDQPVTVIPAFLFAQNAEAPYDPPLETFLSSGRTVVVPAFRIQFLEDGSDVYGLDTVVDAFAAVATKRPDLRLALFLAQKPRGRKPSRHLDGLIGRLEQADLKDRVVIAFGLPLVSTFRHDVVLVRPSRMDGDALSVREALEAGIPVIASNVVERPSGTATFVTDDAADLARVLEEVLDRKDCGTEAERHAVRQVPADEDFLGSLIRIYRDLIESFGASH